jgi:tRNA threonylcarbamoyladenosine biosynthesis protein TsaB
MNILAIDTSTEACSVAFSDQEKNIIEHYQLAPRQHAQLLLPMIEAVLAEANVSFSQIDVLAFDRGPGSFTGLRINASVIQAFAFAHDLPVVPISSLRILAQGCYREFNASKVLSAIDASMNEVYWGGFHLNSDRIMVPDFAEQVCAPVDVFVPQQEQWLGVGNGFDHYTEILTHKLKDKLQQWIANRYPRAQDLIALASYDYQHGHAVSAEQALPVYLRDDVVKVKR